MKLKNLSKKITLLILLLVLAGSSVTPVLASSANFNASAVKTDTKAGLVIDSQSGQILYANNIDQKLPIASVTKLITTYLTYDAIKRKQISWNTLVKVDQNTATLSNNTDYSNVPLVKGHRYTVKALLEATLIASANGAAMALANKIAGSQVAFVHKMQKWVKQIGIKDAKIYTVNGLENKALGKDRYPGAAANAENLLSARDVAKITQKLLHDYPEVLSITKVAHKNFVDRQTKTEMTNWNWMLPTLNQFSAKYPVDGLKTGTTDAAGACFVGTMPYQKRRLISVVLGAKHVDGTDPSRFVQTKILLNYVMNNYHLATLKRGTKFADRFVVKIPDGSSMQAKVVVKNNEQVWQQNNSKLTASFKSQQVFAPVDQSQTVGYFTLTDNGQAIKTLSDQALKIPATVEAPVAKANVFVRIYRWFFRIGA